MKPLFAIIHTAVLACCVTLATAQQSTFDDIDSLDFPAEELAFDDKPMIRDVEYPDWFKLSFLDLPEDLDEAQSKNKRGLMVYFGQRHCAYCRALMEVNFSDPGIVRYTRKYFDVIPIDIWSDREVVDIESNVLSEKAFAEREQTNFTPSIIFYDLDGEEALRLRGYYPPYQFRAALEYVADGHYLRSTFKEYLERGDMTLAFSKEEMIEEPFFQTEPYLLDRSRFRAQRPLAVLFEKGNCYACEVLHNEFLQDSRILGQLRQFDTVQIDIRGDTPILTPDGQRLRARDWATKLNIFYSPTIVFFDQAGKEIFRIDSMVRFNRLSSVLQFISSGGYKLNPYFQRWREIMQTF